MIVQKSRIYIFVCKHFDKEVNKLIIFFFFFALQSCAFGFEQFHSLQCVLESDHLFTWQVCYWCVRTLVTHLDSVLINKVLICNFSSLSPHLALSLTWQASLQLMPEDECQLWWAAKELQRGKKLQDYVGKNEKTKLVVKLQKVGFLRLCSLNIFLHSCMCFLYHSHSSNASRCGAEAIGHSFSLN